MSQDRRRRRLEKRGRDLATQHPGHDRLPVLLVGGLPDVAAVEPRRRRRSIGTAGPAAHVELPPWALVRTSCGQAKVAQLLLSYPPAATWTSTWPFGVLLVLMNTRSGTRRGSSGQAPGAVGFVGEGRRGLQGARLVVGLPGGDVDLDVAVRVLLVLMKTRSGTRRGSSGQAPGAVGFVGEGRRGLQGARLVVGLPGGDVDLDVAVRGVAGLDEDEVRDASWQQRPGTRCRRIRRRRSSRPPGCASGSWTSRRRRGPRRAVGCVAGLDEHEVRDASWQQRPGTRCRRIRRRRSSRPPGCGLVLNFPEARWTSTWPFGVLLVLMNTRSGTPSWS